MIKEQGSSAGGGRGQETWCGWAETDTWLPEEEDELYDDEGLKLWKTLMAEQRVMDDDEMEDNIKEEEEEEEEEEDIKGVEEERDWPTR